MEPRLIVHSMSEVCDNGTSQDVSLDIRPGKVVVCWQRIVARDVGNDPTLVEVGIKRGSNFYLLKAGVQGAANRTVEANSSLECPGHYIPTARFKGATVGDTLELYAFGEVVDED